MYKKVLAIRRNQKKLYNHGELGERIFTDAADGLPQSSQV